MTDKAKNERSKRVRRPLAPRYTPFQREQLRWALRCHRWKRGITWEKYPYEIRAALGMERGDAGINDKDPKSFLLFESEPKDDKLWLFERFVQVRCPEYLSSLSETSAFNQVADVLFRFLSKPGGVDGESKILDNALRVIETVLFFQKGRRAPSAFGNCGGFYAFRKLGASPYLSVCTVEIEDDALRAREGAAYHDAAYDETIQAAIQSLRITDYVPVRNRRMGVAVPIWAELDSDEEYAEIYLLVLFRDSPAAMEISFDGRWLMRTVREVSNAVAIEEDGLSMSPHFIQPSLGGDCLAFRNNELFELFSKFDWAVL